MRREINLRIRLPSRLREGVFSAEGFNRNTKAGRQGSERMEPRDPRESMGFVQQAHHSFLLHVGKTN